MLAFYLSLIENETGKSKFEEIYYTYRKQMFLLADSILNNKQDAEDAVHDVFCSIASTHMDVIMNTGNETDIRNYLLKSVKNASVSMIRKRKVRADYQEEIIANISVPDDEQFIDEICTKLDCADVTEAMDSLDRIYRDVLYYHFVLGLTIPETAKILDRKANTVQKQLVRGKSLLLDKIACIGGIKNANEKR